MNQMLLALLSSMMSNKGGPDLSGLISQMSGVSGSGGNDKMSLIMSLLPQLMNKSKPTRKEDEYLKEAETMYSQNNPSRQNDYGQNQNSFNENVSYGNNQNTFGNINQNGFCNQNCGSNSNGNYARNFNPTVQNSDCHHCDKGQIEPKPMQTFSEIDGFSTNEVHNALFSLMKSQGY